MTLKSALFCLFLYVCLVWAGGAYLYSSTSSDEMKRFGLLWTSAGLAAALLLMLVSRIASWYRALRLRAASRPKPIMPAVPVKPLSEDEQALAALLQSARAALARRPANEQAPLILEQLPLYLLIGPEASGKTSVFAHSKLDGQLLAGDAETSQRTSTRFCNLWLARNALFLEVGGRIFNGDLSRWSQLFAALNQRAARSRWQQFWSEPEPGLQLAGVIACYEAKEFPGAVTPQSRDRLDRQSRDLNDRLGSIAEAFATDFPLHVLITKCDGLPYFGDYFRRLQENESDQILGAPAPSAAGAHSNGDEQPAARLTKALTKSFAALYQSLATRRLSLLSHEPELSRRPNIYEFPRELKRIRGPIIQFLTAGVRVSPLRHNPQLSGFYFSGTGEVQASVRPPSTATSSDWTAHSGVADATVIFRADATQIFRAGETSSVMRAGGPPPASRWLFLAELFERVVLQPRPAAFMPVGSSAAEKNRKLAAMAVCIFCFLLCLLFLNSWRKNDALLSAVNEGSSLSPHSGMPTVAELQALEALRVQSGQLSTYEREGAPLSMRWGLYSGNRVSSAARALYFRRFSDLLLAPLNAILVGRLTALPSSPKPDEPYLPVFRTLQTHLMLSSSPCGLDAGLAAETLKDAARDWTAATAEWRTLAFRQIDFYSQELRYGQPCRLPLNEEARTRARQYLAQVRGVDRLYAGLLAGASQQAASPQRLRDLSPDYASVLAGPPEANAAFSKSGWSYMQKASKGARGGLPGEDCVLGDAGRTAGENQNGAAVDGAIRRLYINDYIAHWRKYLESFSVRGYAGPADAARKLDILSGHKSPLLALFVMVSGQTSFPAEAADPNALDRLKPYAEKILPGLKKAPASAIPIPRPSAELTAADIDRYFQPVHAVVPPGSDTWIVAGKNSEYIDALAQLGHAMQDIARSESKPEEAVYQAANERYVKAMDAARQVARNFRPSGVGGLDVTVERLLAAPIQSSQRFIINADNATAGKINGEMRQLCGRIRSVTSKYPFSPSGPDAALSEVASLFAPGAGAVWRFQGEQLGELVAKEADGWKVKDLTKKPQVTQETVAFLNRAQKFADAFYPGGAAQPHLTYTLRPRLDAAYKDATLELDVDGQMHTWTTSLQKQFVWPTPDASKTGVVGRLKSGSFSFPFASRGGSWAMFRVMGDAEPRPLGSKVVEWRYVRGGDGRLEEIKPTPVRIEFVEFPGGIDLFNPKFFEGFSCPAKAVQ